MSEEESKKVVGYVVGYGKPPAEHRFKKGQSGNPLGRPRGKKNKPAPLRGSDKPTQMMLLDEAYRPVMVREGDNIIELPAIQAVFRAMGVAALKGNRFAQKTLAELVQKVEQEHHRIQYENMEAYTEYKIKWAKEFERCRHLGLPEPQPLPHPDDVLIDYRKGTFRIAGPITAEEKASFDKLIAYRDQGLEEYRECTQMMKEDPENSDWYLEDRAWAEKLFNLVNDQLPDRYKKVLDIDRENDGEAGGQQEAA